MVISAGGLAFLLPIFDVPTITDYFLSSDTLQHLALTLSKIVCGFHSIKIETVCVTVICIKWERERDRETYHTHANKYGNLN